VSFQTELAKIKQNKLAPIYLLQGTEKFLADQFLEQLVNQLGLIDDEMNKIVFDMESTPLSEGIEEATSAPFFGEYRLVMLDHPYFLTGDKRTGMPEHHLEELLAYLKNPLESTILVMIAGYPKLDERKKVVKELKKTATLIDVSPMEEKQVREYVAHYIAGEGYDISPEAYRLLLERTNMDLSQLMAELDKLFLTGMPTKKITRYMVESLVPKTLEQNIFDMTSYVLKKDTKEALNLYHDLVRQGEETIKINSILISQVRLLLHVQLLGKRGYPQKNMAQLLKVHPYRIKLAIQQAKHFQFASLASVLDELIENDYGMKTGMMDKELLFELFLLKTASLL